MLETLRAQHDANATDGLRALGRGVLSGVQGVLLDPLRGARQGGVMGFIRGMESGLSGVILRPVGGVLQFVSIETEAASRALRGGEGQESTVQVRPRRALRKGAVIRPYDLQEAAAQRVLKEALGRGHKARLVMHGMAARAPGAQEVYMLTLTPAAVVLVGCEEQQWRVIWRLEIDDIECIGYHEESRKLAFAKRRLGSGNGEGPSHLETVFLVRDGPLLGIVQHAWLLRPTIRMVLLEDASALRGMPGYEPEESTKHLCTKCFWGSKGQSPVPAAEKRLAPRMFIHKVLLSVMSQECHDRPDFVAWFLHQYHGLLGSNMR